MAYHIHIWEMSPQLSCGDICQMWMWFEESNMYFCKIGPKISLTKKLTIRDLLTPTPGLSGEGYLVCFGPAMFAE